MSLALQNATLAAAFLAVLILIGHILLCAPPHSATRA
jgi:hypothetical protein